VVYQTVKQVFPSRMRGMPTVETLGVATGRPSGQRPWKALSTDNQQDARYADCGNPWRCHRSAKWTKATEGFVHGKPV